MSDKDQFTFDDNDDFPEADLSSAFSDGEFEADKPAPDVQEEPERKKTKKSKAAKKTSGTGGSRTRILLLVLLLVVAGGAGAYYFMGLGTTTPVVPTVPTQAQKDQKTVALPPQPAKPVTVAVPPPPAPPAAKPPAEPVKPAAKGPGPAPAEQTAAAKPAPAPAEEAVAKPVPPAPAKPAAQLAAPAQKTPEAAAPVAQAKPAATGKPAQPKVTAKAAPAAKPEPVPARVAAPAQVAGGAFALDAGSYLFESNRDALVAKIKKLGYDSRVTPVDAKVDMTRLRIGTYSKEEVREALAFARSIEPGAYSAPAGDGFVIYAGTFLKKGTVDRLTKRFLAEGVKVHPEPVQVVRTLSRIRFGSFATRDDAQTAANVVGKAGVKAVVVKAN